MKKEQRHPAESFAAAAKVRLTGEDKINLAMAVYLTLEAINESAPRGCDGMPMDLMCGFGPKGTSIQALLRQVLGALRAPMPQEPDPIFEEGRCGCGNKLTSEGFH